MNCAASMHIFLSHVRKVVAMAEGEDLLSKSLQKLDEELTCTLCTQHFREPKVLPCFHYCCKTCIADLIKSANGRPFNCPECHREAGNDPERYKSTPTCCFVLVLKDVLLQCKIRIKADFTYWQGMSACQ